MLKVKSKF